MQYQWSSVTPLSRGKVVIWGLSYHWNMRWSTDASRRNRSCVSNHLAAKALWVTLIKKILELSWNGWNDEKSGPAKLCIGVGTLVTDSQTPKNQTCCYLRAVSGRANWARIFVWQEEWEEETGAWAGCWGAARVTAGPEVICNLIVRFCVQHHCQGLLSTARVISLQKMRCFEEEGIADV